MTEGLPSPLRDSAMSGTPASEDGVLTESRQRLIFPREAQGRLALLPGPAFRRGLSCFWRPVLLGSIAHIIRPDAPAFDVLIDHIRYLEIRTNR